MGGSGSCPKPAPRALADRWIVACDQASGRVLALDPDAAWSGEAAVRWSWRPEADPAIERRHLPAFHYLSEARPRPDGAGLVVAASGGAVASVGFAESEAAWYVVLGGNPHAVEPLPDGAVATASSTGGYLSVFEEPAAPGPATLAWQERYPLPDAHALAWDEARGSLWALGGAALHVYRWRGRVQGGPSLYQERVVPLPASPSGAAPGGHDLLPLPGSAAMLVSDERRVWTFDRDTLAFAPFAPLADVPDVKSLSCLPGGGDPIFVAATRVWWSDTVSAFGPERRAWTMPGARFYKARWLAARLPLLYRVAPGYRDW